MKSNKPKQTAPSRAIRLPEVCRLIGVCRATVWRRVQDDPSFPRPFKLSAGVTVWREAEILDWLAAKQRAAAA